MKKPLCLLLIAALAVSVGAIAVTVFAATEPLDEYPGGTGDTTDLSDGHKEPGENPPPPYADTNDPSEDHKEPDDDPPAYYDPSEEHKEPDDDPPAYYDPNGDGSLNAQDVVCVMRYLAGYTEDGTTFDAADYNRDGRVNARDVLEMMLAIVNAEA